MDFDEKGLRDLVFGFVDAPSCEGMSCGIQRMPGSRPRSLAFIVGSACACGKSNNEIIIPTPRRDPSQPSWDDDGVMRGASGVLYVLRSWLLR